ncbi:MAG: serine/threonine-protein kinase [Planctomycetota bacterium]
MEPDQIQSIFDRLIKLSPAERKTALESECGDDREVREQILELFAKHESGQAASSNEFQATLDSDSIRDRASGSHSDFQVATQDLDGRMDAQTSEYNVFKSGSVISKRFTLQKKIGEGGMGEVWVASQHEPVKRKVAIKLIKAGMDSRAVIARFEQERQALALMNHPNIARVLDGGMAPNGHPFFVMELVDGVPLNEFCDRERMSPRERLELFVPICQAIQHAHQKGIVHRDLKPANILVSLIDGRAVPKVIDFGVAKATGGKLTDQTISTQFGAIVGTLEYMSPEQAGSSGSDVDTRSDIYSLGVVLYELLTGLRPLDKKKLKAAGLAEMIRVIQEEDPSKPSTRLSTHDSLPSLAAMRRIDPRKLTALLRGELDWIVLKCMDKQRDRRYGTANGLARDIQRYLVQRYVLILG